MFSFFRRKASSNKARSPFIPVPDETLLLIRKAAIYERDKLQYMYNLYATKGEYLDFFEDKIKRYTKIALQAEELYMRR